MRWILAFFKMLEEVIRTSKLGGTFFSVSDKQKIRTFILHTDHYEPLTSCIHIDRILEANNIIQRIGCIAFPLVLSNIVISFLFSHIIVTCIQLCILAVSAVLIHPLSKRFNHIKKKYGSAGIQQKMFGLGMFLDIRGQIGGK
jgi:hypothetical protein